MGEANRRIDAIVKANVKEHGLDMKRIRGALKCYYGRELHDAEIMASVARLG